AAVTLGTDLRSRPRSRTRPVALRASRLERDGNLRLDPLERVFEREVDLDLDVVAALSLRLRAPTTAAAAEEAAEEVAEIGEVVDVEVAEIDVAALEAAAPVSGAERVVLLPLLGVGEQVVGVLNLLEPLLRGRISGIAVGVVLARKLAVGLLDLV